MIRKGLAGGFCFKRVKVAGDERYHDQPDKNQYSHPVEALEYAMLGAGEGRMALQPDRAHVEAQGPKQRKAKMHSSGGRQSRAKR